jgi:hypothetical protein
MVAVHVERVVPPLPASQVQGHQLDDVIVAYVQHAQTLAQLVLCAPGTRDVTSLVRVHSFSEQIKSIKNIHVVLFARRHVYLLFIQTHQTHYTLPMAVFL